ncbi:ExbD/TolR family protein [Allosphingosinicella sp.]|uniref:ExbD/TolR family protein n=1 Tax=Allosphingosinicella sp. TaxID=2823234 RepID=UPI0037836302
MLALLLAATLAGPPAPPVIIAARRDGRSCQVSVDGRPRAWPVDERRLFEEFRRYRRAGRSAHVQIEVDTPYRCIGAILYLAQRAKLEMGFVGNELIR